MDPRDTDPGYPWTDDDTAWWQQQDDEAAQELLNPKETDHDRPELDEF